MSAAPGSVCMAQVQKAGAAGAPATGPHAAEAPAVMAHAAASPPLPLRPRIGMGVFVQRPGDGAICLGQRINSLGHGEWALPGGHLEHGETFEACAVREVRGEGVWRVWLRGRMGPLAACFWGQECACGLQRGGCLGGLGYATSHNACAPGGRARCRSRRRRALTSQM
jgi:hypothetical protein